MARRSKKIASWEADTAERAQPQICSVSGKRIYASEHEAGATASHQMTKTTGPIKLRTYLCLYCNAWHLTSKQA